MTGNCFAKWPFWFNIKIMKITALIFIESAVKAIFSQLQNTWMDN